ncbi:hypothetical protein ACC718_39540, partial [Rhizobium ruizarguesonis]
MDMEQLTLPSHASALSSEDHLKFVYRILVLGCGMKNPNSYCTRRRSSSNLAENWSSRQCQ